MARRDKDLLGLEVVSLDDASVVGEVDGLIVDEAAAKVVGLVVDMGLYEAKALSLPDAHTVGEDAILVENAELVKPISQAGKLEDIARRSIHPDDAVVLTDTGDIVGITGDYFLDPESGEIRGLEVLVGAESDADTRVLPMESVVRIGADIVLIAGDYASRAVGSGENL